MALEQTINRRGTIQQVHRAAHTDIVTVAEQITAHEPSMVVVELTLENLTIFSVIKQFWGTNKFTDAVGRQCVVGYWSSRDEFSITTPQGQIIIPAVDLGL